MQRSVHQPIDVKVIRRFGRPVGDIRPYTSPIRHNVVCELFNKLPWLIARVPLSIITAAQCVPVPTRR